MTTLKLFGTDNADQEYARALRAIGKDLASLFPEKLEIEVVGTTYKVQYQVRTKPAQEQKPPKSGALQKLFRTSGASEPTAAAASLPPTTKTYTQETLDNINATQSVGRHVVDGSPDIYELSERLRTVGRVVDKIQGKLVKVTKGANSIQFQYTDAKGLEHTEELSNHELYRMQREFFSSREHRPGNDVWNEQAR